MRNGSESSVPQNERIQANYRKEGSIGKNIFQDDLQSDKDINVVLD